jgi:hypothetical protein
VQDVVCPLKWRQPVHELIPVGPLRVRAKIPRGMRGKRVRLLVSGRKAAVTSQDDWRQFEVKSVLDHEVAVIA